VLTAINERLSQQVGGLALTGLKAYPNPFDPNNGQNILLEYSLNQTASGKINIYTISGDRVKTINLASGFEGGKNGINQPVWDGKNDSGELCGNGMYFYVIELKDSTGNEAKKQGRIVIWKR
jgi:flagellar hook assembly protein FlgD